MIFSRCSDEFAQAFRENGELGLGSWNWKQVHVGEKKVYVNINSLAKRLGISKDEAKQLVREGFEAGVKAKAAGILGKVRQIGIDDMSGLVKKTTVTFKDILSAVSIKQLMENPCMPAQERKFVYFDEAIYEANGALGKGSYKQVDSYAARILGKGPSFKALSLPRTSEGVRDMELELPELQQTFGKIKECANWALYCHLPDTTSVVSMEDQGVPLGSMMKQLDKLKPPLTQEEVATQMLGCLHWVLV